MELERIIEQAVSGLGYELVDFETSPRARLLRLFIDHPSGVTIESCTAVSNHLTHLLAVENIDYDRLEVSSPGLDRVLKKIADFEKFSGQEVRIRLHRALEGVEGRRNFVGLLSGVINGMLQLEIEGVMHTIDISQIERARLVPML